MTTEELARRVYYPMNFAKLSYALELIDYRRHRRPVPPTIPNELSRDDESEVRMDVDNWLAHEAAQTQGA